MGSLEVLFKKWKENARILTVQLDLAKKMNDTQKKKIFVQKINKKEGRGLKN